MGNRRSFFKNVALFFTGTVLGQPPNAQGKQNQEVQAGDETTSLYIDDAIKKEYELVVVGGGISGTSAAISAARNGMKVALVHNRSMFGGNSSSEVKLFPENNPGHDPWIKEGGIHEEFHTEERVRNHDYYLEGTMNCHWDLVLYEWVHREENIDPYLNTHMHRVMMKDDATIASVYCVQLGTNKDYVLSAPLFVDASGDGNLGYFAGADYKWGREGQDAFNEPLAPDEPDEKVMGNTLFFTARDTGSPVPFKRPDWAAEFETEEDLYSRGHGHRKPSGTMGGYWWIEIGAPYHPIKDMNEARHEGLRQLLGVWDHIKNKGDHQAENYGLEFAGSWPYKRASRRLRGDYILTQYDVQDPQQLEDAVAYGVWHMDVHIQGGILARDREPVMWGDFQSLGTMVYGIPLRSLYSRNVNNLLMAGRPISTSYLAFASTRVLSTGSICGEAVGVAAALAQKYDTTPRQVAKKHARECQQMILRQDGHIPGVVNEDPADLARKATASASSSSPMVFPEANDERELKLPHGQLVPISEDRIDSVELRMRSERSGSTEIRLGLRPAPSVWDFRSEEDLAVARASVPGHFDGWVKFELNTSVTPGKLYYVYTDQHEGVYWQLFRDSHEDEEPSQTPIGTTAALQPVKPPRSEQSPAYRETYPPTTLEELPGTGKKGRWEPLTGGQSLSLKVTPQSDPYGAENVNSGTNRPDQWSNIWISDPGESLPAWLQLSWPSPQRLNTLQLTFDTNQNYRVLKPLYRYPECVKEYVVEYRTNGGWKEVVRVQDNYRRRRVHQFDPIRTRALRVRVLATNGAATARIYEMRVYNEK